MNERDVEKALTKWLSMSETDQSAALADARQRAMTSWRTPELTAAPYNHLLDHPWTRKSVGRILPEAEGTLSYDEKYKRAVRAEFERQVEWRKEQRARNN
jgi:hypothetical protein